MNYVTNTFPLVSSSLRSKQLLCFVQDQGQNTEQYRTAKSSDEFLNHYPLLTMLKQYNLYNNQINARALIGQSAVGYCAGKVKPTEKSHVFSIII